MELLSLMYAGVTIRANATVPRGSTIYMDAVTAAGSVVDGDVPRYAPLTGRIFFRPW